MPAGEALSGLARAFFYAGARSLLVSHWAVNSDATVKLVTKAYEAIAKSPATGRAEAMRRSMLALIEGGGHEAHPSYWAPFIVAGSGGTVLRELATAAINPAIPPLPKRAPASLKRAKAKAKISQTPQAAPPQHVPESGNEKWMDELFNR